MHPLEKTLIDFIENGVIPSIGDLGGVEQLIELASEIGTSPLMPEFLRATLSSLPTSSSPESELIGDFVCRCLEVATQDLALYECVDLLDRYRPLPGNSDERCFDRFLAVASDKNAMPTARAAALDGAFRWAISPSDRTRQLQLSVVLLKVKNDESPILLARVAKIMGVAYSYFGESGFIHRLQELATIDGVADEAAFEMGMAKLYNGLNAKDNSSALQAFSSALYWFGISTARREQRLDADIYIICLEVLIAFADGQMTSKISRLTSSLKEKIYIFNAWYIDDQNPSWLGARHTELLCWNNLALQLEGLTDHLKEDSWWEPNKVITNFVLVTYMASRSVLKRDVDGSIESLVQPRIELALSSNVALLNSLAQWIQRNSESEWINEAQRLFQQASELVNKEPSLIEDPMQAVAKGGGVTALVEESSLPANIKSDILTVIKNAFSFRAENVSSQVQQIIEKCCEAVSESPDYSGNKAGRRLFHAVLFNTILFLESRLDMQRKSDPHVSYLFEKSGDNLAKEEDLQRDYHFFMKMGTGNVMVEAQDVSAGRADVYFYSGNERIITEVKREMEDSSFESLKKYYAGQASEYQATGIRLGFLLVLDLTEKRTDGVPHISTLVQATCVERKGETVPRRIIVVKVPGRKVLPSELTALAKTPDQAILSSSNSIASASTSTKRRGVSKKAQAEGKNQPAPRKSPQSKKDTKRIKDDE